jgi:hypothetical protein
MNRTGCVVSAVVSSLTIWTAFSVPDTRLVEDDCLCSRVCSSEETPRTWAVNHLVLTLEFDRIREWPCLHDSQANEVFRRPTASGSEEASSKLGLLNDSLIWMRNVPTWRIRLPTSQVQNSIYRSSETVAWRTSRNDGIDVARLNGFTPFFFSSVSLVSVCHFAALRRFLPAQLDLLIPSHG